MESKKYISDIISNQEIESWKVNDTISVKCGTGFGKSYFIMNKLYDFASKNNEKILFLVHRRDAREHFQKILDKEIKNDYIQLGTYQLIEHISSGGWDKFNLQEFKYVVVDESHYFMSDSLFNHTTDISFNEIMEAKGIIRLFMSATGEKVNSYINSNMDIKTINYEMDIDFAWIKSLTFYNDKDSLEVLIDKLIKNNQKAILFFHSIDRAFDMYTKYKEYSFFNCSKTHKPYCNFIDMDKIDNMLGNGQFDDLLLFTTTSMDTAVSIKNNKDNDFYLHHIVIDGIRDIDVIKQCIGRKRLDDDKDGINLAIRGIKNNTITRDINNLKDNMEKGNFLKEYDSQLYSHTYGRKPDTSGIVYAESTEDFTEEDKATFKINQMAYYKHQTYIDELQAMKDIGKWGYNKYVANELGFEYGDCAVFEDKQHKQSLEEYLESIVGVRLFGNEQQELSDLIIKELITLSRNIDYRTKKLKPSTLENIIREQLDLPFAVSNPEKESKGKNRGKRYIVITKLK